MSANTVKYTSFCKWLSIISDEICINMDNFLVIDSLMLLINIYFADDLIMSGTFNCDTRHYILTMIYV